MKVKPTALFLSHGGGPLPLLGDKNHAEMIACLQQISKKIKKPSAIVVISAHWEEDMVSLTSAPSPPLIYDYYGFPEESYTIQYPCPGEPALAKLIHDALAQDNIASRLDDSRGYDHGLFVPLKIMYPDADIPCIQLSLLNTLDAEQHIKIGQALAKLNYENLLIIGSGFSFHNMQALFNADTAETRAMNEAFENWLLETCSAADIDEQERHERLIQWESAPAARFCHPREEHLIPLHVCYGLAQSVCTESFELLIMQKKSSMFLWTDLKS